MRYSCAHWMSPPMLSPDEAREEAWRAWMKFREGEDQDAPGWRRLHIAWNIGWDARGRYDEQRIAELDIPGPEECTCHAAYKDRGLVAPDCAYHEYEDLFKALRALGQLEEVKQ